MDHYFGKCELCEDYTVCSDRMIDGVVVICCEVCERVFGLKNTPHSSYPTVRGRAVVVEK